MFPNTESDRTSTGKPETWQDTIDQVNNAGGIFYVAHPNYPGLKFSDPYGIKEYAGIEVWNGFYHALDADKNVNTFAFDYWDNVNRIGEKKYFGIANSDGHNSGKMGDPYIKTEMDSLTYDNIQEVLANGNYYGSNGPELRYDIEGVGMAGTLNVTGEQNVDFNITAFDQNYALKNVKLIKNTITGSANDGSEKEVVYEKDLNGQNLYEFHETISLPVKPGEFYRIEVISEKGTTGNGGQGSGQGLGFAFSNPIWIGESDKSNAVDIKEVSCENGEVISTIGDNMIILTDTDRFTVDNLDVKVSDGAKAETEITTSGDSQAVEITVTAEDGSKDTETVYLLDTDTPDTQKPVITIDGKVPTTGTVGTEIKLPAAHAQDDVDGEVAVNITVKAPGGENVVLNNNAFTPAEEGVYSVAYQSEDAQGNKAVEEFAITVSPKEDTNNPDDSSEPDDSGKPDDSEKPDDQPTTGDHIGFVVLASAVTALSLGSVLAVRKRKWSK